MRRGKGSDRECVWRVKKKAPTEKAREIRKNVSTVRCARRTDRGLVGLWNDPKKNLLSAAYWYAEWYRIRVVFHLDYLTRTANLISWEWHLLSVQFWTSIPDRFRPLLSSRRGRLPYHFNKSQLTTLCDFHLYFKLRFGIY